MELFREDGHLTDQALEALVSGRELNELGRLEVSEHLAFCDLCLNRYTQQLMDEGLMTPAHSCQDTIWWRIRQRAARLLASRWATAAAAIVLVVSLWNFGVFGGIADLSARLGSWEPPAISESVQERQGHWGRQISDFFNSLGRGVSDVLGGKAQNEMKSSGGHGYES